VSDGRPDYSQNCLPLKVKHFAPAVGAAVAGGGAEAAAAGGGCGSTLREGCGRGFGFAASGPGAD